VPALISTTSTKCAPLMPRCRLLFWNRFHPENETLVDKVALLEGYIKIMESTKDFPLEIRHDAALSSCVGPHTGPFLLVKLSKTIGNFLMECPELLDAVLISQSKAKMPLKKNDLDQGKFFFTFN